MHEQENESQQGFTLIELLVSIGIVGAVIGIVFTTYLTAYRGYNKSVIISSLQEEGARIHDIFSRSIRSSVDATYVDGDLQLTIDEKSLEFQENGGCNTVQFSFVEPDGTANGYIEKKGVGCTLANGGILTKTTGTIDINVIDFLLTVEENPTSQTKLVKLLISLQQGVAAPDRTDYKDSVDIELSVATRGYTE